MKAFEKDRDKRFASAGELAQALRAVQGVRTPASYRPSSPELPTLPMEARDSEYRQAPPSSHPSPRPVPAPAPMRAPEPARAAEPPRPQFSEPLGSRPLQEPLLDGQKRSGGKALIWAASGAVVLAVVVVAAVYISGAFDGGRNRKNSPSPSVTSGAQTTPTRPTSNPVVQPSGSSGTNPTKSDVEAGSESKPAESKPATETANSTARQSKKQSAAAKKYSVLGYRTSRET